jgi:hypothetical protein
MHALVSTAASERKRRIMTVSRHAVIVTFRADLDRGWHVVDLWKRKAAMVVCGALVT